MLLHKIRRTGIPYLTTICICLIFLNLLLNWNYLDIEPHDYSSEDGLITNDRNTSHNRLVEKQQDTFGHTKRAQQANRETNKLINYTIPPHDESSLASHDVKHDSPTQNDVRNDVIYRYVNHDDVTSIWPRTDHVTPASDRILSQLRYVPASYNASRRARHRPKLIYLPSGLGGLPSGRTRFLMDQCPVSACALTADSRHDRTADLKVLQSDAYFEEAPTKPPGQIWMLWLLESPANTVEFRHLEGLINWTATYRTDSTLVTPYEKFVPYKELGNKYGVHDEARRDLPPGGRGTHARSVTDSHHPRQSSLTKARDQTLPDSRISYTTSQGGNNYHTGRKRKLVAWFVSNCGAKNKRWEYVQQLQRHLPVDVYGECGTKLCPRNDQVACDAMLSRDYKFYLSFENSNCQYYITEKFFHNALRNNVVPIVMGARRSDYLAAAPAHSYIHVEDFPSARDLAHYLLKLNQSDSLYDEYFAWKSMGQFIDTRFWCRVCAMLHDDVTNHVTWYRDVSRWWQNVDVCTKTTWGDKVGHEQSWKGMRQEVKRSFL